MSDDGVVVVGGGVIGVCSAYYLAASGFSVTLLEQSEISSGCSSGNAGLLTPSHSIPIANPGALRKAIKWLFNGSSPFYIRPQADPEFIKWLLMFAFSCRDSKVQAGIPLLRDLSRASMTLYVELANRFDFGYRQLGLLMLYNTPHGWSEGVEESRLLSENGLPSRIMKPEEVVELEPSVSRMIQGAVYFPEDGHLTPSVFVKGLAQQAKSQGAVIQIGTKLLGFETVGRKIVRVITSNGELRPAQVVFAPGAWASKKLTRHLGFTIPVQPAKGYSVTVQSPSPPLRTPLLLSEAKVAVTPMGDQLRFGGTLELAGMDLSINRRRLEAVRSAHKRYLSLPDHLQTLQNWSGLRPCTPDGLPIIGRSTKFENLVIATGHAMIGVSLGPITGYLVSQLIADQTPAIDIRALSPARFN